MLSYHGNAVLVLDSHYETGGAAHGFTRRVKTKTKDENARVCVRHRPIFLCWIDDAERAESAGERAERAGRIDGDGEIRSAGHVSHRKRRSAEEPASGPALTRSTGQRYPKPGTPRRCRRSGIALTLSGLPTIALRTDWRILFVVGKRYLEKMSKLGARRLGVGTRAQRTRC